MDADTKSKILLVDDEPANLMALEALLEDLGQPVLKARSATEALKYLLHKDVAVILLDVEMPEVDGFETASLIRAREKSRATPIIFLTAHSDSKRHIAQAYSAGAVDYLTKPYDPAILKAKVAVFVEMARNIRHLEAEIARRHQAEAEVRQLNSELERRVQERTAHIEALNRRLEQMLAQTHDRVRNNLQMLTALIEMQYEDGGAHTAKEELSRIGSHIRVLAIAHDLLAAQSALRIDVPLVPVHDLLYRIIDLIQQTTTLRKLFLQVEEAYLEGRPGTSLGLITSELCSNALKHGKGDVELTFSIQGTTAQLQVCDDGPGFGDDFFPEQSARTGLHLIEDLTHHDLQGHIRYENRREGGARVIVSMPHKRRVQGANQGDRQRTGG